MSDLADYIRERCPLRVSEFMALALMHPHWGYYQKQTVFGAAGDFVTAPEISQIFGEMIGMWCAARWADMGMPAEISLVELGPGRGTLLRDLLRATRHVKGFHDAIQIHCVERSRALRDTQKAAIAPFTASWHDTTQRLPHMPMLIIANEFFDALPIRQFIKRNGQCFEKWVTYENGEFCFIEQKTDSLPEMVSHDAPENVVYECAPDYASVISDCGSRITAHGGAMLVIDYGYTGGTKGDTLQAVRGHAYADVLRDPGSCDITAHVDFDRLHELLTDAGLHTSEVQTQGSFLLRMGAKHRAEKLLESLRDDAAKTAILQGLERLISPTQMGSLFKVVEAVKRSG